MSPLCRLRAVLSFGLALALLRSPALALKDKVSDGSNLDASSIGENLRQKGLASDPFEHAAADGSKAGGVNSPRVDGLNLTVGRRLVPDGQEPPLNVSGSEAVAPAPGFGDRFWHAYDSLLGHESASRAAALAAVRSLARQLTPEEIKRASDLDPANGNSVQAFVDWLAAAQDSDLPQISYAVLASGEIGYYQPGPGKGEIFINHSILNEPADVQAAVFAHELFHYWDLKVSSNFHEESSNYGGRVDPQNMPALEYVPYGVTKIFASHAKPAPGSRLLAELVALPDDPDRLKSHVQAVVDSRKR